MLDQELSHFNTDITAARVEWCTDKECWAIDLFADQNLWLLKWVMPSLVSLARMQKEEWIYASTKKSTEKLNQEVTTA